MEKYAGIETFDELASELMQNEDTFTSYETLKDFAVSNINSDNLYLAIHVLEVLEENRFAEYFVYDYSMGTLETPEPMHDMDDLLNYINSIY